MGFKKISLSIDDELLSDIEYEILKIEGKIEPHNSYGKYFYGMLRDRVPHRNSQVTEEGLRFDDNCNCSKH